jgi:NAD(P)-dependent dehydrogenase (short-subunit alcohol dehydrogenase family)
MKGKIVLITGATSGIGREAALALARLGAQVVIVGRDQLKTQQTTDWIKQESGSDQIDSFLADLAEISDIKNLADQFSKKYHHLDVLLNNAGSFFLGRQLNRSGFERTWMTNYLSPVLLTSLLLKKLEASPEGRIINVSSALHKNGKIEFDNLNGEKKYSGSHAYANSKLALVLYTFLLAKKLVGTNCVVNALHPGVVATGIWKSTGGPLKPLLMFIANTLSRFGFILTPEQGAKTLIYLASSPEVQGINGKYFVNCKEVPSAPVSYETELQQKLWDEMMRSLA